MLDLILYETYLVVGSDPPAIPEGICGSFFKEFRSRTGSEPLVTYCHVFANLLQRKWLQTSRGMFPNDFGMTQLGPYSSAKLLLGGTTTGILCVFVVNRIK